MFIGTQATFSVGFSMFKLLAIYVNDPPRRDVMSIALGLGMRLC